MNIDLKSLSAGELDTLIVEARKQRASMEPQLPGERPAIVEAALNPLWYVSIVAEGSLLQIGHKNHGWSSYVIPRAERVLLMSALLQHCLMADLPIDSPIPIPAADGTAPVH